MTKCKICKSSSELIFTEKLLNKYNVKYFFCNKCNFLQTEDPYWLEESYSRSINFSDTGYIARNIALSNKVSIILYLIFGGKGRYLDFAGGYGVFVRLMRDIGFDFYWEDKYTRNVFAPGFEWNEISLVNAVTAFEVFEHYVDPMSEIEKLLKISNTIIFSTELYPSSKPSPKNWWYFGLDHGQHISFYSEKTFEYIAHEVGAYYYSVGNIKVLSKNKIPYWKLFSTKFSKYGVHKLFFKLLNSKTMDDYHEMVKKNENSI